MDSSKLELSYEFFPPRTDAGRETLVGTLRELETRSPEFYSVTFGAGGSTLDKTVETVVDIQQNSPVDACPHLTCVGASNQEVIELLESYRDNGIRRLLVLRGDLPSGMVVRGECNHANELMEVILDHFGDHFTLLAAAYPEAHPDSKNMQTEVKYFVQKMNTGASAAITQYFYQHESYVHFMDLCHRNGLDKPVIPGIMPIANFATLKRFSRICGADIPRWIKKSMATYEDDPQSQRELGVDIVTSLCAELIADGAPGLHFYTMNQSALTCRILDNLGLPAA